MATSTYGDPKVVGNRRSRLLIGNDPNLGLLSGDGATILHARFVMRGAKRHRAVEQHHGGQILRGTESGLSTLSTLGAALVDRRTTRLLHVGGIERMLPAQINQRIERGLDWASGAPFLDDRVTDLEAAFAQAVHQLLGPRLSARRFRRSCRDPRSPSLTPVQPDLISMRGRHPVARPHRAENEGLPRYVARYRAGDMP